MNLLKNTIIVVLLLFLIVVCNKEQKETIVPVPHTINTAEKTLLEKSNQIGFDCFKKLLKNNYNGDNIIFSPINISLSFNLLIQASDEFTKREIKQYLHVNHLKDSSIIEGFDKLNKLFSEIDENIIVKGQNQIAMHANIPINENISVFSNKRDYISIIQDENAGFVENLKTSPIHGEQFFQMINSIDFSAQVKYQSRIEPSPFYATPDESKFINMAVATSIFNYYADISLQAVELPLGRGNYNILILVPRGSQTLNNLAENLDGRLLKRIQEKYKPQALEVYLPLMELSSVETLREVLISSRLNKCFNEKTANFTSLSKAEPLYLSDYEQIINFSLKQNESDNLYKNIKNTAKSTFLVDKPFLFIVYEKYSEGIIFIGKIAKL
ncbi:MAG: serpin family protein [Bacteroidales bacterium]|nr:serpin family protein [Bacteroidales bacterium]